MYRCKTIKKYCTEKDSFDKEIAYLLMSNHVRRQEIIDIKTFAMNDWLYCTIIWEDLK